MACAAGIGEEAGFVEGEGFTEGEGFVEGEGFTEGEGFKEGDADAGEEDVAAEDAEADGETDAAGFFAVPVAGVAPEVTSAFDEEAVGVTPAALTTTPVARRAAAPVSMAALMIFFLFMFASFIWFMPDGMMLAHCLTARCLSWLIVRFFCPCRLCSAGLPVVCFMSLSLSYRRKMKAK